MNSSTNTCGQTQRRGVRCPFYSFTWPAGTPRLVHEPGNRCGLALDRVAPCAMEQAGRPVEMSRCPVAEELKYFIRSASPVIAFVTPEDPDGVPYPVWCQRTMRPQEPVDGI